MSLGWKPMFVAATIQYQGQMLLVAVQFVLISLSSFSITFPYFGKHVKSESEGNCLWNISE
jgi:hypothetical protein